MLGAAALGLGTQMPAAAHALAPAWARPDPRIAIIDTDDDLRKLLSGLAAEPDNRGVEIVARYYARDCQPDDAPFKRIAFNQPGYVCGMDRWSAMPEQDLLFGRGLALLSVYQYCNNNPAKFLFGLADVQDRIARSNRSAAVAAPEAEAEADAEAALAQALAVGQPDGTPIYFGIDFDIAAAGPVEDPQGRIVKDATGAPVAAQQAVDAVLIYFARLKALMGNRLGAYGNGFINRILRKNELVRYSWVSESRAFAETAEYLSDADSAFSWHLFQNQIDRRWFTKPGACAAGFDLDTVIQNPGVKNIGAWNANGSFEIASARTREIFRQRWVATRDNIPVFAAPAAGEPLAVGACRATQWKAPAGPERNRSVRVTRDLGEWIEVDIDEDGMADGFCQKAESSGKNFVESIFMMPKWWREAAMAPAAPPASK
jgi:hypothetical protein